MELADASQEIRTKTPPVKKQVLCVVLSYNGREDTSACLDSILSQKVDGLDVIVVDNASGKGVIETLKRLHPEVEIFPLSENLGWAGGNNVGIEIGLERGYDWICLLNNDLIFPDGEVKKWFSSITDLPPCLLHPSIYYWSEPDIAQLCPIYDGKSPLYVQNEMWNQKSIMNFAYGTCLAVHRDIFSKVSLFDERFFLQLEETDFYYRAKSSGYNAICDPSVKIYHKESRAFGGRRAPIKTYYATRNTLLLTEKKSADLKEKLKDIKILYWSLSCLANEIGETERPGKLEFLKWLFSRSPSARAIRLGIKDYFLRRFGKIPDSTHKKLLASEALLTLTASS